MSPRATVANAGVRAQTSARAPVGERLLTLADVARILSVSPVTVRRRVADASLPAVCIKGRLYFEMSVVRAYIAAHSTAEWRPPER